MNAVIRNNKIYIVGTVIDCLCISQSKYPVIVVDDAKQIPTVDITKHSKQKSTRTPRQPRRK